MNLIAVSPDWLLAVLALALMAAAVHDAARLKVSNIIVLVVMIAALVAMALYGFEPRMWQNFALFAAVLVVGTFLFSAGMIGGGDVKLLAACCLWCSFRTALTLFGFTLVAGGVLALLILLIRLVSRSRADSRWAVMRPGSGIPYAVAIATAMLFMIAGYHLPATRL